MGMIAIRSGVWVSPVGKDPNLSGWSGNCSWMIIAMTRRLVRLITSCLNNPDGPSRKMISSVNSCTGLYHSTFLEPFVLRPYHHPLLTFHKKVEKRPRTFAAICMSVILSTVSIPTIRPPRSSCLRRVSSSTLASPGPNIQIESAPRMREIIPS